MMFYSAFDLNCGKQVRRSTMKLRRSKSGLRSINAQSDKTGRILGCFASSVPVKGFVCEWPQFQVLSPPLAPKAKVERTVN